MVLSPVRQCLPSVVVVVIVLLGADLLISGFLVPAEAVVTPPLTSSGLNTQVSAPTPVTGGQTRYNITGGTRPDSGPNLFHSFGKFDVPANNIANFLNDTNIPTTNILSRVTGGNPSNIFGTIQTTGFPGAHLFLMNPAGVVFGPTAQLNVEGSFHVTTADYLRFDDVGQSRFYADIARSSILSTAPVTAFGFLVPNSATTNSINLSGDNTGIFSQSFGNGPGGDVSVHGGTVTLADHATIHSGEDVGEQGGRIEITGTAVSLSSGSRIFNQANEAPASPVHITTPVLVVDNASINTSTVNIGRGGDIVLDIGNGSLVNGARVDSSTSGAGAGGTVTLQGLGGSGTRADLVAISGPGSGIFTNANLQASRPGGGISVHAGVVTVSDGGTISAASDGVVATATGGTIDIEAGQVQLTNGGIITAKSFGPANAGSVRITVDDSFVSQSGSITTEALEADGGDIHINAGRLIHLTNSEVTSTVGSVDVTTTIGGNIFIDPEFVILDNSRILANAFAGTGGNINIVAGVLLVDPLSIIDASSALGVSGTVTIQSPISSLSETLAPLPQAFLRTGALLSSRCVARLGGPASSFVVAGRDAIPMEPGGLLPSPLYSFEAVSASANSDERPQTPNLPLGSDGLVVFNLVGLDAAADCAP